MMNKNASPIWFMDCSDEFKILENFSFNMILNLANVCNADSADILWDLLKIIIKD